METIKLDYTDVLVCDPCYIKSVKSDGEDRFDALKCVHTLHDGDDGEYGVKTTSGTHYLGVDSGRIWIMRAEFGCEVEIDSGISGHLVIKKDTPDWCDNIELE